MHVAALDSERRMVVPDSIGIGRVEKAVNLTLRVVEQLDLADAELVARPVLCILGELLDRLRRQLQLGMKIHELRHFGLQVRRYVPPGAYLHRRPVLAVVGVRSLGPVVASATRSLIEEVPLDDQGLVTLESAFSASATIDRLVDAVGVAGLLVFSRIDHAKGAADVGAFLRPTQLLVFGHPRGGTPLMQERQTAGIDLPLKALAWEDENGRVWLTYDTGQWISTRHGLGEQSSTAVAAIDAGLAKLAAAATSKA